jgi:hypothetical protein
MSISNARSQISVQGELSDSEIDQFQNWIEWKHIKIQSNIHVLSDNHIERFQFVINFLLTPNFATWKKDRLSFDQGFC